MPVHELGHRARNPLVAMLRILEIPLSHPAVSTLSCHHGLSARVALLDPPLLWVAKVLAARMSHVEFA